MNKSVILACAAVLVFKTGPFAINGFSVTTACRTGNLPESYANLQKCGKIVRFDITGNAVSGVDTLYSGLAWYPKISFDGTRVAFLRSQATLNSGGTAIVGHLDTGYVSVVNKDGTGLRDLVKLYTGQYGWSARYADCEGHFVGWPAGDWVYYEKPPKTGEIWRVNVNNTALHHMVVRYNDAGVRPGNCACDINGSEGFWLRRWQLSADAKYCGGMFKVYPDAQQLPHRFPPPEGYAPLTEPLWPDLPACNLCISASGEYLSAYFAGCHDASSMNLWNHVTNIGPRYQSVSGGSVGLYTDIRTWCGRDVGNLGQYMRWAANSDKWLLVQTGYDCSGAGSSAGNQVLCNWKDRAGMCLTGVYAGASLGYDAGDLWISDPTNNPGGNKYEDPNGNWVTVTPRDIYLTWTVTGIGLTHVSIAAYPADAEVRYTTDGADPTQSSNLYAAQLDLTPGAGRVMQVKARAFRTGMGPAETESRLIVPSSKALPAGYVKELLCLETTLGSMVVPAADTAAVLAKYAGENKPCPFDGDQVTVNAHTYTWHLRTDDDGVWSPATGSNSLTFWYTTIVTPISRMAKLGTRFHGNPRMYLNGHVAWTFDGWDSNHEWIFAAGDGAAVGLVKGANGVLMLQHADGVFGVRFLSRSNDSDLTDLQYFPYSGNSAGRPVMAPLGRAGADVSIVTGQLLILPGAAHAAWISDVNGRTERVVRGLNGALCRLPLKDLGDGMHLVTLVSDAGEQTWRVLVR